MSLPLRAEELLALSRMIQVAIAKVVIYRDLNCSLIEHTVIVPCV